MPPSNYPGDFTATRAPSPPPDVGVAPIVARPIDTDARNAASVEQPLEVLADFAAWSTDRAARCDDDFYLEDDFVGASLDAGKWIVALLVGATAVVEGGTGARGQLHCAGNIFSVETVNLDLGLLNFRASSRLKVSSLGGALSAAGFGLQQISNNAYFQAVSGTANWTVSCGGASHTTSIAVSGGWQRLEIRRAAGVITFYIDGVVVYSETITLTMSTARLTMFGSTITSGATVLLLDYAKMWAKR